MKKLLFFSLAVLMTVMASAKPVNPDRAVQVAKNFVAQYVKGAENFTATVVYTHPMPKSGQPAIYAVNVGNKFVLVSANDIAHPVLGYSLSRPWPEQTLPAQVSAYLDDLAAQIETAAGQQGNPDRETTEEWHQLLSNSNQLTTTNLPDSVGPLLTTTWDQDQYYNALCPEDTNGSAGHVYTGCVATAMAQIINYWGYPLHGRGTHSYNSYYGTLTVNYDSSTYDYAHMPDALTSTSTPQEVNAVAKLMYDCGVALNMGYLSSESGAFIVDARASLVDQFKYNPHSDLAYKHVYNNTEWMRMLRVELSDGHPLLYSGQSGFAGHAFVCDGYNASNYYHFNFGWSGNGNGWYLLSSVNPGLYSFNSNQFAVLGIVPDSLSNTLYSRLGYMRGGYTEYIIDSVVFFGDMLNENLYQGSTEAIMNFNTVTFYPADTTRQLMLEYISFSGQSVDIFDGNNTDILLRQYIDHGNNTDFSPVISSHHALTLSIENHWWAEQGFRFRISYDNGCRLVSNVEATVDTTTIHLHWHENGDATQWQVEYGLKGFNHIGGTRLIVSDTIVDISQLSKFTEYDIYIRSVCDSNQYGPWNRAYTVITEARYWKNVVNSQPQGYEVDANGNVEISSAEGLTWFAKQSTYDNNYFSGHVVKLTQDINLGMLKWSPIEQFSGVFDGQGHKIDSMYSIEINGETSLFHSIDGSVIKNVNLTNCYSKSMRSTACGIAQGSPWSMYQTDTIMNCYVSGIIDGMGYGNGVIMGRAQGTYIINCASNCDIIGYGYVGGIVGAGSHAIIRNCYSASFVNIKDGGSTAAHVFTDGDYCIIENGYGFFNRNGYRVVVGGGLGSSWNDYTWFTETDTGFYLMEPVFFESDSNFHTNLTDVLNKGVEKYNIEGLKLWVDDTSGINEGMPLLGPEYLVTCHNVKNISAKNCVGNNGAYGVALSWEERGTADTWELKYHIEDSVEETHVLLYNNPDTLWGLTEQNRYLFSIRPVCDSVNKGGWSEEITHVFDRPYWIDVVTSQPNGYEMDASGNVSISTAEGMAWLISVVNGLNGEQGETFENKRVVLLHDVDMSQYKWTAINGFLGLFNGNNHTINGLYVNELRNYQGLFGNITGGTYSNIILTDAIVKGFDHTGMLFGFVESATIINCHASGLSYSETNSGGIAGRGLFCMIDGCSTSGLIQAKHHYAGGLLGDMNWGTIRNSFSSCNVLINGYSAGGIVGPCYQGNIENCYATGNIGGSLYNGGVLGCLYSTASTVSTLKNCYFSGALSGFGYAVVEGPLDGMLVGCATGDPIISNCYAPAAYEYFPMVGAPDLGYDGWHGYPIISDTASFEIQNGEILLLDSVAIGQLYYDNILSALNAWVDANDTIGIYRHWVADTAGENRGFPVFAPLNFFNLTLNVDDNTQWGSVDGGGVYSEIERTRTITAIPQEGYHFMQWSDGNTDNPRVVNITQDTVFTAQFGVNMYSIVGVASTTVFFNDFENSNLDNNWTLLNGSYTNRWQIAPLDNIGHALFISNDNGLTNSYTNNASSYVFAYTTLELLGGQYDYGFDWRCNAERNWDFLRVALLPALAQLNYGEWTASSLPGNAIALDGGNHLQMQSSWITQNGTVDVPVDGEYKLVFFWRNDNSFGDMPPAAVDNIQLEFNGISSNSKGYVLGSDTVPYLDTVTLSAVPNRGYRFVQWNDGNTDNPRSIIATDNVRVKAIFECIPTANSSDSIIVCDSYLWNGIEYTSDTILINTLTAVTGCDSTVMLHLTVNHGNTGVETVTACDSYTWHGTDYTASNSTATFTETNAAGCDSVVTLNLTVNYSNTGVETVTACDSYTWHGANYTASNTTATFTETNAAGCDSVVTLNLTVNYSNTGVETVTACDSYTWHGTNYIASNTTATFTETNAAGCDSVVTLNLTVNYSNTGVETVTTCDSYTWHGTNYTANNNTATFTETNANGCDSVVTLNLTVNYSNSGVETVTACDTYTWHGTAYTASNNTATFTETNAAGCDSVVTLNLTINYSNTGVETVTACDIYTWHGTAYTASTNTPTFTETNAAGCDSVVTLNLTINYSDAVNETDTACEDYFFGGQWIYASGQYTDSLTNIAGCDSIVTLNLTINNPIHEAFTEVACDSYTWQGATLTVSGDYTFPHDDANGCTQVDTLHLTINYSVETTVTDTAEDSYSWQGTTYTESGTYQWQGTTAEGCDSTVTLMLVINHVGIGEIDNSKMNIDVYPNPTTGQLTIDAEGILSVEVFDPTGRKVATHERTNNIDLAKFPTGTYLLKIHLPSGTSLQRVILK